ncbi:MAG: OmpA family protein [Hyphomonadaceae bacterium]
MGDSRSFRDAFSQRKAPASDGLGTPDKFRDKAAKAGKDAFKTTGAAAPSRSAGDAFALKAKPDKQPRGTASTRQPKAALTPPKMPAHAKPAIAKMAKAKLPKSPPEKLPRMAMGKTAPLTPVQPAQVRPQKMTVPLPPNAAFQSGRDKAAKLTKAAPWAGVGFKNPFGRSGAHAPPQKALVPAASAGPSSPMTKPAAKPGTPPAKAPKITLDEPVREAPPAALEPLMTPEEAKAEAVRAPLQIVPNESVLDHIGFKKFRRAARSSSLVLVSGAAADAIGSTDTLEAVAPEAEEEFTTITVADNPETPVADKPAEPTASPSSPPSAAEPAMASTTGGDGPAPPAPPKTPEPVAPVAPAEAAAPVAEETATVAAATVAAAAAGAAAAAEKPVEVVEAIVEPPASVPYDTASEPVDQLLSPKSRPKAGTARAVETSWQDVAGGTAKEGQPAAAVLRKVETSPVAGYWGGATAGAKSALVKRGFNQDDIFGVVFGLAVLAFLLLWFVRGRGEETPAGDLLATPQSVTGQSFAAMPTPPPTPKVDPFGDAPVNLKPTGPIPNTAPGDPQIASVGPPAATPAPAAPMTASPPTLAANPEAAIPIAERKMHAWFCTASSRMTKSSRAELKGQMAKFEDVFAGKELVVRGYADTRGSTTLNADLGSRRAQTVADYLKAKGLSVVDVQGVGELDGLDDNQNCSNQRRVDVWVKGGPAEAPSRECAPEPDVEALVCSG